MLQIPCFLVDLFAHCQYLKMNSKSNNFLIQRLQNKISICFCLIFFGKKNLQFEINYYMFTQET